MVIIEKFEEYNKDRQEKEGGMEKLCPICHEAADPSGPDRTAKEWIWVNGRQQMVDVHTHCMYENPDKMDELKRAA